MEFQKEELEKELCQTFKRFYAETSALKETDYFIKLVYNHFMLCMEKVNGQIGLFQKMTDGFG